VHSTGGAALHKTSTQYLTATVTGLLVAILFSLTAIIVRGIAAPEIDGKISAYAVDAPVSDRRVSEKAY
jgi:hypothetical protein